ncbi:tubulin polyglutamylase TTLL4-like isoform X4 [Sitophilus oryzae]|uniref:Tubulin polyglutamylase TTLL4-like isoform X4 n=1 Tax=Sitophilus oryzae TaxID=7048 RepID=A0A6J2YYY6_SITOR|nr:tubulin polyglutamylase TTLL4-like isoform X4 [Sitophilus oryzae]
MEEYNFSLTCSNTSEIKEKYCKYSYSSWCVTCEKNSPRRRSRSETNESCRKKCKEMKTLTPKKYNKCNEYENMELEYDFKGWHDTRSNLVELPTSYISNNCQLPQNISEQRDDTQCLKSVNGFSKLSDIKLNYDSSESMENNGKIAENVRAFGKYSPTICQSYIKCSSLHPIKQKVFSDDIQNANSDCDVQKGGASGCKEYCQLSDYKCHELPNRKPLCYETDTYFNRPIDRERYTKEVDRLREKLRILQKGVYTCHDVKVINLDKGDSLKETFIASPIEIKPKIKKDKKSCTNLKTSKSKVSLKIKKNNINKTKKLKSKDTNGGQAETSQNDLSGSESDVVEDDSLDEDSESVYSDPVSTDDSTKDSTDNSVSLPYNQSCSGESASWPVRSSLFPNIPPYIKFRSPDLEIAYKLPAGKKFFKWKLSTITPVIVRKTLTNSGFALVRSEFSRESNQWLGTWGKHMKSANFVTLKETQKLNHFPGTFQLGRKDRLWRNFQKMIAQFGLKEFGFLPHTYVLPQDIKLLKQRWDFKNGGTKEMWIIKPPASARGAGIKVINKWSQLPKKTSLVCQKYVNNPYLINGSKFDLRLYVLVTSFHPLRIYLYPDGLARFASVKYSDDIKDLKDRYMHLTNYSINKLSSQYTANEDANACHGHKWTVSKLMEYMHDEGVDTKTLWTNLQKLVIKTIISSESLITPLCEESMLSYYNCYELFGIDVLLDEYLKPWLLEVNISPSLHSASPLDAHVKGPLVQTLLDMAQFHFPPRLGQSVKNPPQCFDGRLYTRALTKRERKKHKNFTEFESREDYVYDILKDLTGDDVRHLLRAEDEFVVKGKFERIFPTEDTHTYLGFMESRYYNRLFDAWETKYASRRDDGIALLQTLCAQKIHLNVPTQSTLSKARNIILSALHSVCSQCRKLSEYDPWAGRYEFAPVNGGSESSARRNSEGDVYV